MVGFFVVVVASFLQLECNNNSNPYPVNRRVISNPQSKGNISVLTSSAFINSKVSQLIQIYDIFIFSIHLFLPLGPRSDRILIYTPFIVWLFIFFKKPFL